ncbi:HAMP domain-containing sensor histidine kinase [uncultured Parolsenella sp.]|uniref:sensor histidine kinase n=2 Tax=Atopobiaceae TaxID=1643824 RepID=UPI0025ECCBE5|nr:HAMP domain-containing sensor histidine kinase [uncultured Parolsenella sp.]
MRAREGRRALPPELARLRRRVALASSALMALVLAASLAGAWLWSARGYASEADAALQQAAGQSPAVGDGSSAVAVAGPYPVVRLSLAGGPATDETGALSALDAAALAAAVPEGAASGSVTALGREWRFERLDTGSVAGGSGAESFSAGDGSGGSVVLVDVTAASSALRSLVLALAAAWLASSALAALACHALAARALVPAAEAWECQERFVADASHELKTPLASMSATLDALTASPGRTVGDQARWTGYLRQDLDEMDGLVRRLVEAARGPVAPGDGTCDASLVASALVGRLSARATARGITLSLSVATGTAVACGADDLSAILGELLANAIKYTDEGGSVRIAAARRGRRVAVSVSNTGPGIAPADVPRVFDRLWRGDAARTRGPVAEGYGLGLAIARRRAEALGGSISCESDPGRLTTFTLELPAG